MSVIDAYVAELDGVLRGPRRAKADLLTEARHSLVDATEAYRSCGYSSMLSLTGLPWTVVFLYSRSGG